MATVSFQVAVIVRHVLGLSSVAIVFQSVQLSFWPAGLAALCVIWIAGTIVFEQRHEFSPAEPQPLHRVCLYAYVGVFSTLCLPLLYISMNYRTSGDPVKALVLAILICVPYLISAALESLFFRSSRTPDLD